MIAKETLQPHGALGELENGKSRCLDGGSRQMNIGHDPLGMEIVFEDDTGGALHP